MMDILTIVIYVITIGTTVLAAYSDIKRRTIPLFALLIATIIITLIRIFEHNEMLTYMISGVLYFFILMIGVLVFNIGGGDAIFFGFVGYAFGAQPTVIIIGIVAVVMICHCILRAIKHKSLHTTVPLVPYVLIGEIGYLIFHCVQLICTK